MSIAAFSTGITMTFSNGFDYSIAAIPDPPPGTRRLVRYVSGGMGLPAGQFIDLVVIGSHRYLPAKAETAWEGYPQGFQVSTPAFDILEGSISVALIRTAIDGTPATTGQGLGRFVITGEYIDL